VDLEAGRDLSSALRVAGRIKQMGYDVQIQRAS
jgi:hypothetical protein